MSAASAITVVVVVFVVVVVVVVGVVVVVVVYNSIAYTTTKPNPDFLQLTLLTHASFSETCSSSFRCQEKLQL